MSANYKWRGQRLSLYGYTVSHEPDVGETQTQEWIGDEEAIKSMYRSAMTSRFRCNLRNDGPVWYLSISTLNSGSFASVTVTEAWSINTDVIEKSIWMHPNVKAIRDIYDANPVSDMSFKAWLEEWVNAEEGKSPVTFSSSFGYLGQNLQILYKDLVAGTESYQAEAVVARRTRTARSDYGYNRYVYSTSYVYSTAQIGLPNVMWISVTTPQAELYTNLGWRLRTQEYSSDGSTSTETLEWVWGRHSSLLYSVAP